MELTPVTLVTLRDAAKVLGCSPSTIRNLFDRGQLAGTRLSDGSRVVYGSALIEESKRRQAQ